MGYFVTYHRPLGNLLIGVSLDQPPFIGDDIVTEYVDAPVPDLNSVTWSNGSCSFIDIPVSTRVISKYQFVKRLNPDEYASIKQAATMNAQVGYFWEMFESVEQVDLDLADTISALQMMESGGIIGAGRAKEILK